MLVGNKSDKVSEREVSAQEGKSLAQEFGCEFIESSAKTRLNVEFAFYEVVRLIRRQREGSRGGGGNGSHSSNRIKARKSDSGSSGKKKDKCIVS